MTDVTQFRIFTKNFNFLVSKLRLKMPFSSETPFRKEPLKFLKLENRITADLPNF